MLVPVSLTPCSGAFNSISGSSSVISGVDVGQPFISTHYLFKATSHPQSLYIPLKVPFLRQAWAQDLSVFQWAPCKFDFDKPHVLSKCQCGVCVVKLPHWLFQFTTKFYPQELWIFVMDWALGPKTVVTLVDGAVLQSAVTDQYSAVLSFQAGLLRQWDNHVHCAAWNLVKGPLSKSLLCQKRKSLLHSEPLSKTSTPGHVIDCKDTSSGTVLWLSLLEEEQYTLRHY